MNDVFRSHYAELVKATIRPVALACELYAKGLISWAMKQQITEDASGTEQKATALMNEVEATMKSDPDPAKILRKFCEAVDSTDIPSLKQVTKSIKSALGNHYIYYDTCNQIVHVGSSYLSVLTAQ